MILAVLILLVSLFLIYQGLSFNYIVDMPVLVLNKFASNNMLSLIRMVLGKYTLILGVVGVVLALFLFICRKIDDADEKVSNSFWVILIAITIIAIFTVI